MFARRLHLPYRLSRSFATHSGPLSSMPPAVLHLKSGQSYAGKSFGAPKSIWGETVFSTSITSCA
jgi:carbamoyl-phosphate synthase small subunit